MTAALAGGRPRLVTLAIFGAAMGWLEGVVVVYIRALLGLAHAETYPPPEIVIARMRALPWLIPTEQSREAATIIMLASVAWLAAGHWRGRLGAFLVEFGVWDITYYIALYALIRWPPGLGAMDMLFLIPPHPWWYQPVWVPVAISCVMIGIGVWLHRTKALPSETN